MKCSKSDTLGRNTTAEKEHIASIIYKPATALIHLLEYLYVTYDFK